MELEDKLNSLEKRQGEFRDKSIAIINSSLSIIQEELMRLGDLALLYRRMGKLTIKENDIASKDINGKPVKCVLGEYRIRLEPSIDPTNVFDVKWYANNIYEIRNFIKETADGIKKLIKEELIKRENKLKEEYDDLTPEMVLERLKGGKA